MGPRRSCQIATCYSTNGCVVVLSIDSSSIHGDFSGHAGSKDIAKKVDGAIRTNNICVWNLFE